MTIPLNIDWLTLTWLKLRAAQLWRRARLNPLALALLMLGIGSGCVPVTRFEETQSAAQVELEGRRRAEHQLAQIKLENAELEARLREQSEKLEARDQALAQAELDSSNQGRKRQDAEGMVEQLRGELARVGGHLQSYHDDKQKLEASRNIEAERSRALARLARDAALLLAGPIAIGEYALDAEHGRITLAVPREHLLADDGNLKPEAQPLLKSVIQLLSLHPQAKLRIEDSSAVGDAVAVSRVVSALTDQGVSGDRFEPLAAEAQPATAPAAAAPQIVFGFALP